MPHLRSAALATSFFLLVASSAAAGQTIPSNYTFVEHSKAWTAYGGLGSVNPGQLGLGPRNSKLIGGRFALAFGGAMGLDLSATMFQSKRDILDVSRPVDDRIVGRSDITLALVDARLRVNLTGQRAWRGIQPVVVFGGGLVAALSPSYLVEQTEGLLPDTWFEFGAGFAASFGGGANYHLTEKISFRFDGIINLWKLQTPVGWLTTDANADGLTPEGEWVSVKSFTLGASWRF